MTFGFRSAHFRDDGRRKLLVNVFSLYAVQGCTYLLPLLTIPYLSRVLGPTAWGAVLFSQAIGAFLATAIEYGFDFSATREVARFSEDKSCLRELLTGVIVAKLVLALLGIAVAFLIRPFVAHVAASPILYWSGVGWGIAQGVNMFWYFQGLQRMTYVGALDIAGRIVATVSIFVLVHRPEDGWKVMLAQALGCAVSHSLSVGMAAREVGVCRPKFRLVWNALSMGWNMFLFRSSMTLVSAGNGIILGLASSAKAVAFFGSADKFRQLASQGLWPINQTLFPHLSERMKTDPRQGIPTARRSLLWLGALSSAFGAALIVAAPVIVRIVLGPGFGGAVPVLRVFGLLIPLQALCTVLSAQLLLPLGMDRQVSSAVLTAGVISTGLGILLSIRFGAVGMAVALTVAQFYTVVALNYTLRRKGLSPFSRLQPAVVATPVTASR